MVDLNKLKDTIQDNGLKLCYIAEKLGLTRYGLHKKMTGETQFLVSEIATISEILHLDASTRDSIFFAKEVSDKWTK